MVGVDKASDRGGASCGDCRVEDLPDGMNHCVRDKGSLVVRFAAVRVRRAKSGGEGWLLCQ
jgi:hypothetical protein